MIQFYAPDIAESKRLDGEESSHCIRVLRKKEGDTIFVTDGKGTRFECRIVKADPRGAELELLNMQTVIKSWSNKITLAVAPTKNADRMSWLVEKATEIGVDRICFIKCKNSERKNINIGRLRRNAISAMNQSLKTLLPEINEMTDIKSILKEDGEKYFGYCDSDSERSIFAKDFTPGTDVIIAIGPEGDFSEEEVKSLKSAGYKPVTFGDERLRTETAAIYSITAVHVIGTREEK